MDNTENLEDNIIKIKGKLDKKLFPKKKMGNGDFGILSIKVDEELEGNVNNISEYGNIVIKGNWCEMDNGQDYTMTAREIIHPTYGKQYELICVSANVDFSSKTNQLTYLESFLNKKQVENLYNTLKDPFEAIERGDMDVLCTVKGIGEATATRIIDRYRQHLDYSEILIKLDGYGLTQAIIQRLVERYGSPTIVVGKVKENVYILADEVNGIGFKKADEIAIRNGINPHDPRRVKAFARYYLSKEGESGNSWVHTEMFFAQVYETCGSDIEKSVIQNVLREMLEKKELWASPSREHIALTRYFQLEESIYLHLQRLSNARNRFKYDNWKEVIKEIEEEQGWNYTQEQIDGVKTVLDNQVTVVTGLGGTGKSTITNAMLRILSGYTQRQCALAGRASQRMKELNGVESNTIHKTFGYQYGQKWACDENNPLNTDILILDEASMVNGDIFIKVVRALKTGTKLVIIGDYGQLPTIGNCNVFLDLISIPEIPVVKLTEVHRQAQASAIISKSIDMRNQKQLFDRDFEGEEILGELQDLHLFIYQNAKLIKNKMIDRFMHHYRELDDIMKIQVVVPMKTRGEICTQAINKAIQPLVNKSYQSGECGVEYRDKKLYIGDKIINNTNKKVDPYCPTEDDEKIQIYNGNIGTVAKIDIENNNIVVDFGEMVGIVILDKQYVEKSIDLAYAITTHKLQGSSAERIIVGLDSSAYMMICSEQIYTAITRAEKHADLVAENKAVRMAISKVLSNKKQTFLPIMKQLIS